MMQSPERKPALPVAVRRLHHEWETELGGCGRGLLAPARDGVPGEGKPGLGEALALFQLGDGELGALHAEWMRQAELGRDARGDRDRPVDAGCDHPVDLLSRSQPLERRLVLGRDQCTPVGEGKARRPRFAVGGDDIKLALARRFEQTELPGPGAEHQQPLRPFVRIARHGNPFSRLRATARLRKVGVRVLEARQ